jgi:fructose-1-phosphate kinase PfkB-like protein
MRRPFAFTILLLYSLQALKYIHTPQTDAAGFGVDVTILLKIAGLDVVAQGKTAVETKWIIIAEDVLPE